MTEWYVNDKNGSEQSWDTVSSPAGYGDGTAHNSLVIEVSISGNFHPVMNNNTQAIGF